MHRTTRALTILALLVPVALAGSWSDAGRDFYRELRLAYPGLSTSAEPYMVMKAEQVCANGATDALWATWDNGSQIGRDFWNLSIEHLCPEHTDKMRDLRPAANAAPAPVIDLATVDMTTGEIREVSPGATPAYRTARDQSLITSSAPVGNPTPDLASDTDKMKEQS